MRFEESRIGCIDRMTPSHATADNRDRLCAAPALSVRANGIGAADRVDAQLPERAVEEAVIGAAAKFAVRDKFEAQPLLQPDRIGNGFVFGRGELRRVDLAFGETGAFAQQFGRTQEAADMLGAVRRLRCRCIGGRSGGIGRHRHSPALTEAGAGSRSGILTPSAFATVSNSSHSFAGIGMPDLRRAASVRLPRSPGNKISSTSAWHGSALTIAPSA